MEHGELIMDELPAHPRFEVSSEYDETHENRILLFEDPDAVRASWGDVGTVKQWVRKDSLTVESRFIHNWAKWAGGGNDYEAVEAETPYKSEFPDDVYTYHGCSISRKDVCGTWNFLARYGQYTIALRYSSLREPLSEEEFEQLVAHVDRHVADVLGLLG